MKNLIIVIAGGCLFIGGAILMGIDTFGWPIHIAGISCSLIGVGLLLFFAFNKTEFEDTVYYAIKKSVDKKIEQEQEKQPKPENQEVNKKSQTPEEINAEELSGEVLERNRYINEIHSLVKQREKNEITNEEYKQQMEELKETHKFIVETLKEEEEKPTDYFFKK